MRGACVHGLMQRNASSVMMYVSTFTIHASNTEVAIQIFLISRPCYMTLQLALVLDLLHARAIHPLPANTADP